MSELATIPTPAPVIMASGAATIEATAHALVDAHKIGTALCRTSFVPKHFQGKPDDAAAAILYGSTIDMDPVTALQNIYVISGKPALYARTMVAIVLSKGHEVWTEEETDGAVTVAGRRKGSENIERVTWTTEMAKTAGYLSNANYKSNSRAMLYARASGDVARRIAPDALLGMAHNVEELTLAQVERPASERPTGLGAALRAEQVHDEPTADDSPPMTDKSRREMFALFTQKGIPEEKQLVGINQITGADYTSRGDLTEDDCRRVIDSLRTMADADTTPAPADEPGGDA